MTTPLSNSFDVLNTVEKEDVQNPKVSDHAGTSSSNLHVNKDQEESLWSRFNKGKENDKSKSSELEDESDDDEVYMPHGGGFTDGMEDDLECYDGYGTHVFYLYAQEQAFLYQYDIRPNSVVVKNELKRGNSGLLANASGLCERIRANDVEIQYRESTNFALEGITLQLIRYDNNHAATVKKHDALKKHVKTNGYEEHLPFIQKCVKGTDVIDS
ncbi:hypothetical protein Tco_0608653 [Tanacetum coccineum]